jgi:hypothetical protein
MPSKRQWITWAFGAAFLGFVAMLLGCRCNTALVAAKTNNLRNVDCNKHGVSYAGKTTIVVNASNGIEPEDEMVFVCPGENIHWQLGNGVKSVDVHFLNGEWPFSQPYEGQLHGDSQTLIADREIGGALPPNVRAKAFKYQIHVVTNGSTLDLDPHIIRMGP